MSDNARDTQFAGFAKLLLKELLDDILDDYGFIGGRENYADLNHDLSICEGIIARRAYDLACHAVGHVSEWNAAEMEVGFKTAQDIVSDIPDMIEWPDEGVK
jgi:hypothetical protein